MPTLTMQQVAAYARAAGFSGDDLVDIVAVATPESSRRTDVVNSIGAVGIWQILQPVHVKAHPEWTVAWLKDPGNNARAAKVLHAERGMQPWQAWTNGSAAPYMAAAREAVASVGGGAPTGTTATPAFDLPGQKELEEGMKQDDTVDLGASLGAIARFIGAAADWLSDPRNTVRLVQVALGGGLVLIGLQMAGAPITAVLPGGKVATTAAKLSKSL